jgi:hypothetical protein
MNKKIYTFLNNIENVENVAQDIIESFRTKASSKNIDYSFDITKGTGQVKNRDPNTFFTFDTEDKTFLYTLKKAMFDDDLKDISAEEEEDLVKDISNFLRKVSVKIEEEDNIKTVRDSIRKVVIPGSKEEDIPLSKISIISIDIADFSSVPEPAKYLVKIGKIPGYDIKTGEVVKYLHEKQEEIGGSVEEIFEKEKEINPIFKGIASIQGGDRYIFDVNITMFVNYSLSKMPPKDFCKK